MGARAAALIFVMVGAAGCPPTGDDDDETTVAPDDDDDSPSDDDDSASDPWAEGYFDHGEVVCADPLSGFDRFTDETAARGIVLPGPIGPEVSRTSTVAAVDGDNDGDIDLFFSHPRGAPYTFENDGTGQFTRVEQDVELPPAVLFDPEAAGVFLLADLTGDGLPDLLTIGWGSIMFAPNLGDLRFGEFRGLEYHPDNYSIAFTGNLGDVDGDGDLDLFVPGLVPVVDGAEQWPGYSYGRLLLNDGVGFVPALELGLSGGEPGPSVLGIFTDRDGDGDQDVLNLSDHGQYGWPASGFHRNQGVDEDGIPLFTEDSVATGTNLPVSGMGIDVIDMNGDGQYDYCLSDLGRPKCLLSLGDGTWYEAGLALGLDTPPLEEGQVWSGWSTDVADFDLDGRLDLVMPAGFPAEVPDPDLSGDFTAQPDAIWQGDGSGGFVSRGAAVGFNSLHPHYGGAVADLNGDGHLEIMTAGYENDVHVFWNQCGDGAWLQVDLQGPSPNHRAFGARVEVRTEGVGQVREVQNLRTYGQGPAGAHFGLGDADTASVRVRWPDGASTELIDVGTRRRITIRHPSFDGLVPGAFGTGTDAFEGIAGEPETTAMAGIIERTAPLNGDGVGTIYIRLYASNPFQPDLTPVIEGSVDADMNPEDASVPYNLDPIPVRDAPYFLLAFLDEDGDGELGFGELYASGGAPLTVPGVLIDNPDVIPTVSIVLDEDVGVQ